MCLAIQSAIFPHCLNFLFVQHGKDHGKSYVAVSNASHENIDVLLPELPVDYFLK